MHRVTLWIALLTGLLVGCSPDAPPTTPEAGAKAVENHAITFLTEDYPPLSFERDGEVTGLSTEVVRELMTRTDTDGTIHKLSWEEAYERVLEQPDTALFSTVMTPARKPQLQWVGPIAAMETNFYARADDQLSIGSLQEARDPGQIAVVEDYYSQQLLEEEGFTNLQSHETEAAAVRALLEGDARLLISDNTALPAALEQAGADREAVRKLFTLSTDLAYIAFSPRTAPELVQRWDKALNAMKRDGSFERLYAKWLPKTLPPGRFQFVTEDYPPVTFLEDGQPAGIVTDMVREIAGRLDMDPRIRLTTWKNAYNMALVHPNVVLFSAERTPRREDKFHWVGPVGRNTALFYARQGSDIEVKTLDDARQVEAIGTTTDWFTEQHLQRQGFDNLVSSPDPTDSVRKLVNGDVQLAIFTDITVPAIVEEAGYSMKDLKPVLPVTSTDFYIALSRGTPRDRVEAWRTRLDELKADGSFREIYERYLPNAELDGLLPQAPEGESAQP